MAGSKRQKTDKSVKQVLAPVQAEYAAHHPKAKIEAYRYNPASIRVRIIDPDFRGKGRLKRDEQVGKILEALPDEIHTDIIFLLVLTPKEQKTSHGSLIFDTAIPLLL